MMAFSDVVMEADKYAHQPWVDKSLWMISGGKSEYKLQVRITEEYATVGAQGFGSGQDLIARTEDELRECIKFWWRHR